MFMALVSHAKYNVAQILQTFCSTTCRANY